MSEAQTQRPFYYMNLRGEKTLHNNSELQDKNKQQFDISSEVLALLGQQTNNFISLQHLSKSQDYNPAAIFLAQTLTYIEGEMNRNPSLVAECVTYLDMMSLYSLTSTGYTDSLFNSLVEVIIHSRTVPVKDNLEGKVLALTGLSDFLFDDPNNFRVFLNNNKYLVAMFTYSLIGKITLSFDEVE